MKLSKLRAKLRFLIEIKEGRIVQNPWGIMTLAKFEDTKAMMIIEPIRSWRSIRQNKWYWGRILPVIMQAVEEHTGNSAEEIDDIMEHKFAPRKTVEFLGKMYMIPKHCKELDKGEFMEYAEKIRGFAAEHGIIIPDPDPSKSGEILDM